MTPAGGLRLTELKAWAQVGVGLGAGPGQGGGRPWPPLPGRSSTQYILGKHDYVTDLCLFTPR